jgi:hypothetical protein
LFAFITIFGYTNNIKEKTMAKFFVDYWQFFVAGLIVLGLIVYWVVEFILSKKAKQRELEQLLLQADQAEQEQTTEQAENQSVQQEQEIEAEKVEADAESVAEDNKKSKGNYIITYDKQTKEWVVKRLGSARASKRTKTKKEAMEVVKKLSTNQDVEYLVKKKDGKFQKK